MRRYYFPAIVIALIGVARIVMSSPPSISGPTNNPEVERKLTQTVPKVDFEGNRLADATGLLSDVFKVNIFVDWQGLKACGMTTETPVTLAARNQNLGEILNSILAAADKAAEKAATTQATGRSAKMGPERAWFFMVQGDVILVSTEASMVRQPFAHPPLGHDAAAITKVNHLLDKPLKADFGDKDLHGLLDAWAKAAGVPLSVNWDALKAAKIPPTETPAPFDLKGVKAGQVLSLMLMETRNDHAQADWIVRDGTVLVTTKDDVDRMSKSK